MFSPTTSRALSRATNLSSTSKPIRICPSCRYRLLSTTTTSPRKFGTKKQTIFSGIQPTGIPHLGNYLGALKPWVQLQNAALPGDRLFFSIVDLHAITVKQDPQQLVQWRREMMASFIGVGLDPDRSILFAQSDIPAHTEMMWVLSCMASMGYLGRMTQWKSKMQLPPNADPLHESSKKDTPSTRLGLFSYPVLQAADILLYHTTHVPVGEDQAQHLEFARELAESYNRTHNSTLMEIPETIISPAKRVMSLKEPSKKMSKSDPKASSRILITDSRDEIHLKIKNALSDSIDGVYYDRQARPGVSNLIDILYHLQEDQYASPEQLALELQGDDTSIKQLKHLVAEAVDKELAPVRERMGEVLSWSDADMSTTVKKGIMAARSFAGLRMKAIKEEMGLSWGFHGL